MSNGSSKSFLIAETKSHSDFAASAVQTELSLIANWAARVEAERNDSANLVN